MSPPCRLDRFTPEPWGAKKVSRQVVRLSSLFSISGCICASANQWMPRSSPSSKSVRCVCGFFSKVETSRMPSCSMTSMFRGLNSNDMRGPTAFMLRS